MDAAVLFCLPFPRRLRSCAKDLAAQQKVVVVCLSNLGASMGRGIKEASFEQADVGCTSEESDEDDGVYRMSACST